MKKKILMSIATLTLALSMSVQAFANPLVVNLNGINRVFSNSTVENGVVLVNGVELADKLALTYTYSVAANTVTLVNGNVNLVLKIGSNKASLNGKEVTLPATVTYDNGVVYFPLQFVTETFGSTVDTKNAEIITEFDTPYFSDLSGVANITDKTKVYTYDTAVDLAIENNANAKKLDIQYDAVKDGITSMDNALEGLASSAGQYGLTVDDNVYYSVLDQRKSLLTTLNTSEDNTELVETGVEISLMTALNNLDTAKMNYFLTEANLALQVQDLDITKVKNNLGLASNYSLEKATANLENTKTTLNTIETTIVSAKQNINSILGLPYDSDIYVENNIKVTEKEYNLPVIISIAKGKSVSVKDAKRAVDTAELNYGTNSANHKVAIVNLEQAKKDVEKNAYTAYNNYLSLVENDKMLNNNRDIAIADYEMALKQYELGYITKYNLDLMSLNIANIDSQILKNKMNYQAVTFQLDHPNLF